MDVIQRRAEFARDDKIGRHIDEKNGVPARPTSLNWGVMIIGGLVDDAHVRRHGAGPRDFEAVCRVDGRDHGRAVRGERRLFPELKIK